jgi:16S rRNA processing protein RimM
MIEIAKILKPQGLKGEVKVECFSHDLDFWRALKAVQIDGKNFDVENVRFYKGFGFLKLVDVNSIEEAEKLRNKKIFVARKTLETKDDEFLISDLQGCTIFDENGKTVGIVESIEKYGSADIINFLSAGARRSFPFLSQVVKSVDINAKKIVVFSQKLKEVIV